MRTIEVASCIVCGEALLDRGSFTGTVNIDDVTVGAGFCSDACYKQMESKGRIRHDLDAYVFREWRERDGLRVRTWD